MKTKLNKARNEASRACHARKVLAKEFATRTSVTTEWARKMANIVGLETMTKLVEAARLLDAVRELRA